VYIYGGTPPWTLAIMWVRGPRGIVALELGLVADAAWTDRSADDRSHGRSTPPSPPPTSLSQLSRV
jgi:hypothetical protein